MCWVGLGWVGLGGGGWCGLGGGGWRGLDWVAVVVWAGLGWVGWGCVGWVGLGGGGGIFFFYSLFFILFVGWVAMVLTSSSCNLGIEIIISIADKYQTYTAKKF